MDFLPDFSTPDNTTALLVTRGRVIELGEPDAEGMAEVVISNAANTGSLLVHQSLIDEPESFLSEHSTVRIIASQQENFRWRIRRSGKQVVTMDTLPSAFCPQVSQGHFVQLVEIVQGLVEPMAHAIGLILNSRDQYRQFMTMAAGRVCHHTGIGGLLRHTAEAAYLATVLSRETGLDHEHASLAIGTAICHDFGKLYTQHNQHPHPGVRHDQLTLLACATGVEYLKSEWPSGANIFVRDLASFGQKDAPSSPELLIAQTADRLSASIDARDRTFDGTPAGFYFKKQTYGASQRTFLRALPS